MKLGKTHGDSGLADGAHHDFQVLRRESAHGLIGVDLHHAKRVTVAIQKPRAQERADFQILKRAVGVAARPVVAPEDRFPARQDMANEPAAEPHALAWLLPTEVRRPGDYILLPLGREGDKPALRLRENGEQAVE